MLDVNNQSLCINQVPEYHQEIMSPLRSDIYNHNLRFCTNYQIRRLEIMKHSFVPSSVKLWNRLEDNVKDSPTLGILKKTQKNTKKTH